MNIYLLTRNDFPGVDNYNALVVAANTAWEASYIHPLCEGQENISPEFQARNGMWGNDAWVKSPKDVIVTLLGIADPSVKPGVILADIQTT